MLVEAERLTRRYGSFVAVDEVSFGIERGEVVGLLGPNGAGKSTTIRMLSSFLSPTAGTARIAGNDVRDESLAVRRHIGYMPESNPLYPEMRTREFLRFRAELKGVPRRVRTRRIAECLELCSVRNVAGQIVGTLSKGYRQRVGLADALLGRPDVLILDEPTIGLDPNQVREVRDLIAGLSERHTVLLSTHILAEAEAVCDRAIILERGRVGADDSLHALSDRLLSTVVTAEIRTGPSVTTPALEALEGVNHVHHQTTGGWNRYTIIADAETDVRSAVFRLAVDRGWDLRELARSRGSLEDVFRRLTREEGGGEV